MPSPIVSSLGALQAYYEVVEERLSQASVHSVISWPWSRDLSKADAAALAHPGLPL